MAEGKEETRRRNQKVTNQSNKQTSVVETKLQRETVQIRSDCKRTLLCMVLRNPRRRLKLEALPVKLFQIFFFFVPPSLSLALRSVVGCAVTEAGRGECNSACASVEPNETKRHPRALVEPSSNKSKKQEEKFQNNKSTKYQ